MSHAEWASWWALGRENSPLASLLKSCLFFLSATGAVHAQEQLLHKELKKYHLHAFAQSTTATYKSQLRALISASACTSATLQFPAVRYTSNMLSFLPKHYPLPASQITLTLCACCTCSAVIPPPLRTRCSSTKKVC